MKMMVKKVRKSGECPGSPGSVRVNGVIRTLFSGGYLQLVLAVLAVLVISN